MDLHNLDTSLLHSASCHSKPESLRGMTHKSQTHRILQNSLHEIPAFSTISKFGWVFIIFLLYFFSKRKQEKVQQSLQIRFSEFLEPTAVCLCRRAVFVLNLPLSTILTTNTACRREYISSSHVFLYKRNLRCLTINRGILWFLGYESFTNFLGSVEIFVI